MKDFKTKHIATALLIFAILLYWGHKKTTSPQLHSTEIQQNINAQKNSHNYFHKNYKRNAIENLRYAYTGSWQKNIIAQAAFPKITPTIKPQNTAKTVVKRKDQKKVAQKKKKTPSTKHFQNRPQQSFADDSSWYSKSTTNYHYAGSPAPASVPDSTKKNVIKKTAQEYLEKIIQTKNISQLVSDFKAHRTDAKTFYSVISSLLSASQTDPKIRVLAYQALGQIPPSMQSFSLIATFKGNETNPEVQSAVQKDLNAYANIRFVGAMNTLLGNNNDAIRITAAQVIQTLAAQVLGIGSSNNHGGVVTAQQAAQIFGPVLQNLNQLLNGHTLDNQVAQVFAMTRNTLQQFLG